MVRLVDGNRGDHAIIGHVTKQRYGHRSHGDTFLVHVDDIAAVPGAFERVQKVEVVPAAPQQDTPPPALVVSEPVQHTEATTEASFDLQTVPGVTPSIARQLEQLSVDSFESLAKLSVTDLMELRGIGEARAEQIKAYTEDQLN